MSRRTPWVDWVAVERAIEGQPVGRRLTQHERAQAITALIRTGLTATEIAERVGCSPKTVTYHRLTRGAA